MVVTNKEVVRWRFIDLPEFGIFVPDGPFDKTQQTCILKSKDVTWLFFVVIQ